MHLAHHREKALDDRAPKADLTGQIDQSKKVLKWPLEDRGNSFVKTRRTQTLVTFVVDASVVVAWALQEIHAVATRALARLENDQAIVPTLWWFEVRNGLVVNERRGRIHELRTSEFLQELARIAVVADTAPVEAQ